MEGYVVKQGHIISNWKNRWLVVDHGEVSYYVDHNKTQLKKRVPLSSDVVVETLPPSAGQAHAFLISFPNKWDLVASVASDELRSHWIDHIRSEISNVATSPAVKPLGQRRNNSFSQLQDSTKGDKPNQKRLSAPITQMELVRKDKQDGEIMEGYVIKQGHIVSNWKSRWLLVGKGELSYYVDHSKTQLKKRILLTNDVRVESSLPVDNQKFVFVVSFPSNKWDLTVSVSCDELRQHWINAIRNQVNRVPANDRPLSRPRERIPSFSMPFTSNQEAHNSLGTSVNANQASSIIMEGFVVKRGHIVSNWKSRWLVLTSNELAYYVDHNKNQLKKKVTLTSSVVVEAMPSLAGQKYVILVSLSDQWNLIASVASEELRQQWIDAIRIAVTSIPSSRPASPGTRGRERQLSGASDSSTPSHLQDAHMSRPRPKAKPSALRVAHTCKRSKTPDPSDRLKGRFAEEPTTTTPPPVNDKKESSATYPQENGTHSSKTKKRNGKSDLPEGWECAQTAEGQTYYYHSVTRETRWDRPPTSSGPSSNTPPRSNPADAPRSTGANNNEDEDDVHAYFPHYETGQNLADEDEHETQRMIEDCVEEWRKDSTSGNPYSLTQLFNNLTTILPSEVIIAIHTSSHKQILSQLPEVNKDTPPSDIKKLYMKLIRFIHPDKVVADVDNESSYLVRHVYMVLAEQYDKYRKMKGLA